jgi:hypothetical protein
MSGGCAPIKGQERQIRVGGRLTANNGEALRRAAEAGSASRSSPPSSSATRCGWAGSSSCCPTSPLETLGIHAVYPPGRFTSRSSGFSSTSSPSTSRAWARQLALLRRRRELGHCSRLQPGTARPIAAPSGDPLMFGPVFTKQFWIDLYAEINEDNVFNGAAALGYYLTLSIFPAFIVILTVIPYLPIQDVDQAIMDLLHEALPAESAQMLEGTVAEVTQEQRGGTAVLRHPLHALDGVDGHVRHHAAAQHHLRRHRGAELRHGARHAILLSVAFVALVVGAFA